MSLRRTWPIQASLISSADVSTKPKRIFDNAKESGVKYFFVEQDGAPQPLQNVANSYAYLKNTLAQG